MDIQTVHQPVLLQSALNFLNVQPDQWYVDATLGGGGHTLAIASLGANVIAFDQDQSAIDRLTHRLEQEPSEISNRITLIRSNFSNISSSLEEANIFHSFSGILFDLGLSSDQLQNPERGFSFLHNGPLDMRMDQSSSLTAQDIVNQWSLRDLTQLFQQAADEPKANQIAQLIVNARTTHNFSTTHELANLIANQIGKHSKIHPATRVFQALRIAVNQEFPSLMNGLQSAWQVLNSNGHLVVISFHSGEDKLVKHFMTYQQSLGSVSLTPKPIKADRHEVINNPRARSAKLRAIEKK